LQITIEEYSTRKNHILQRLEETEKQDFVTKSQFVKELIEITIPVVESGSITGIETSDVATYLWDELVKHNVEYDYSHFIRIFPEDYKRKYLKSGVTPHLKHTFIKTDTLADGTVVSTCECGKKAFDNVPIALEVQVEEPRQERPPQDKKKYKLPESPLLDSVLVAIGFTETYLDFLGEFKKKLLSGDDSAGHGEERYRILRDLEGVTEYASLIDMFKSLENLYTIPALTHTDGVATIMDQMKAETNYRAPATPLQLGMCYLLQGLTTFRQWAHNLSVSPRQHQRIRERLADWPLKKAERIIANNLGSFSCPVCDFNLVSKRGNPHIKVVNQKPKPHKVIYGSKEYDLPREYEGRGMNPIEIAHEVFKGKFKLRK